MAEGDDVALALKAAEIWLRDRDNRFRHSYVHKVFTELPGDLDNLVQRASANPNYDDAVKQTYDYGSEGDVEENFGSDGLWAVILLQRGERVKVAAGNRDTDLHEDNMYSLNVASPTWFNIERVQINYFPAKSRVRVYAAIAGPQAHVNVSFADLC